MPNFEEHDPLVGMRKLASAHHKFQSLTHPTSMPIYSVINHSTASHLSGGVTMKAMSKEKDNKLKWSNCTKAYKLLKEGLRDGTIDATLKPKEVHETNPEFMKYSLQSFCSAFNRIKGEMGMHVWDEGKLLYLVAKRMVA